MQILSSFTLLSLIATFTAQISAVPVPGKIGLVVDFPEIAAGLAHARLLTSPKGVCGNGTVGNGVCPFPNQCCSASGYCGEGPAFCTIADASSIKLPNVNTKAPAVGTCGNNNVGNGRCPIAGQCCSKWGHCGTTDAYCAPGNRAAASGGQSSNPPPASQAPSNPTPKPTSKAQPSPPKPSPAPPKQAPPTSTRPASQPAPTGTSPKPSGQTAYATYHMYSADQSTSTVACSDGANGLQQKGHNNLSKLYPYVMAASFIQWNNPQCGQCIRVTNVASGKSVQMTVIDGCGPIAGYNTHFDMAPEAFNEIDNGAGYRDGHMVVTYEKVGDSPCR
ncbi:hypothetical protein SpCBS45565_g00403 [Spizellomyces sp. 'palustris']|nr:hypothetical protein SpCBS45565_g00403 [Spizellomyces sp. 'palustris']